MPDNCFLSVTNNYNYFRSSLLTKHRVLVMINLREGYRQSSSLPRLCLGRYVLGDLSYRPRRPLLRTLATLCSYANLHSRICRVLPDKGSDSLSPPPRVPHNRQSGLSETVRLQAEWWWRCNICCLGETVNNNNRFPVLLRELLALAVFKGTLYFS